MITKHLERLLNRQLLCFIQTFAEHPPPPSSNWQVSLILVDQDQRKHVVQTFKPTAESSSFKRPTSDMNVASGWVGYVPPPTSHSTIIIESTL